MWSTLLLIAKRFGLKKAIDKLEKKVNKSTRLSLSKTSSTKELKKLKFKLKTIDFSIVSIVVISLVIISAILFTSTYSLISIMGTVGGTEVINQADTGENEVDESKKDWSWFMQEEELQDGILDISGGIYPKDPILKSRAMLLEIIQTSVNDVESKRSVWIEPAYIMGTMYRESGNHVYQIIDSDKSKNLLTDLIVFNPACGKGSKCQWMQNGVSHFIGGKVTGGKDTGDARTQRINTDKRLYTEFGGDHAIGAVQFEIPYIDNRLKFFYPSGNAGALKQYDMDEKLGFIRPNVCYVPDAIYNCAIMHSNDLSTNKSEPSNYKKILQSADFNGLNKRNKSFIRFVYAEAQYGRGHIRASDDEMILELINLVKSGKIEYLDEMLKPVKNQYYSASTHRPSGDKIKASEYMRKTYGITIPSIYVSWYGVYAGCVGRIVWDSLTEEIAAAEKDEPIGGGVISGAGATNGNWLKYPGSGYFAAVPGGKYYSQQVNATIYKQTANSTPWADKSWGTTRLNGTRDNGQPATMASGGCGIYSLSFIATNLYGQDLNPGYCRNLLSQAAKKSGKSLGNYLSTCLHDLGVDLLAEELGFAYTKVRYDNKTAQQFEEYVIKQLKKGNQILGVWKGGPPGWYEGGGHFMVIRGYNNQNNKLRVFSSVGTSRSGWDNEKTCLVELDAATVKKYFSTNRNYFWVIGLPENMK